MSVTGGGASVRSSNTLADVAESFMPLPRHTASAVASHRHARGLDAILLTFDRKVQGAVRTLCVERLELEARKRALLERLSAAQPSSRAPEVLVTINAKIFDNDYNLRRLAGAAAGQLLEGLKSPDVIEALQLDIPSEEGAEEGPDARVWRRRLDTHRASTVDTSSGQSGNERLSYYQWQQQKYGPSRRGSTSIAGAWDGVWSEGPSSEFSAGSLTAHAPAAAVKSPQGDAASPKPVPLPPPRPLSVRHFNELAAAAAAPDADDPLKALLARARELVASDRHGESAAPFADTSTRRSSSPGRGASLRTATLDAIGLVDGGGNSAAIGGGGQAEVEQQEEEEDVGESASAAGRGALGGGFAGGRHYGPRASTFVLRRPGDQQGESAAGDGSGRRSTFRGGAASVASARSGMTAATSAFAATTAGVLPLPRHTLSATTAAAKSRGFEALLSSFPKLQQHALRETAIDVAELVCRREALQDRMDADPLRRDGDAPPDALLGVETALGQRVRRLVKLVGQDGAALVIAAVNDPLTRQAMGLLGGADDEEAVWADGDGDEALTHGQRSGGGGGEAAARVWRRRLDSRYVQPVRGVRGEAAAALHDDATARGGASVANALNRADPVELLSYYQKQQLKYGRGRRGSTSVAGAWEGLFDVPPEGSGGGGWDQAPDGHGAFGGGGGTHRLHASPASPAPSHRQDSGRWGGDGSGAVARRAVSAPRAPAAASGVTTHGLRDPGVVSPAWQGRLAAGGQ